VAFALTAPQVWHGEEELPETCKNLVSSNNILKTLCLQDWVHPKAWLMQGPRQHSRIQGFVIR
jgi:hypothetical protein